jgi:hypothetical protein
MPEIIFSPHCKHILDTTVKRDPSRILLESDNDDKPTSRKPVNNTALVSFVLQIACHGAFLLGFGIRISGLGV